MCRLLFRIGLLGSHLLARNFADKHQVAENADYDNNDTNSINGEKRLIRHGAQQKTRYRNPGCHQKCGDATNYAESLLRVLAPERSQNAAGRGERGNSQNDARKDVCDNPLLLREKNVKAVRFRMGERNPFAEARLRVFTNFPSIRKKTWGRTAANRAILIRLA